MGSHWSHYCPEHLFSFSRSNITTLLKKKGFNVISVRDAPKYLNLEYAGNVLLSRHDAFNRAMGRLVRLVPKVFRFRPYPLYVGQMLVVAQKQV